MARWYDVALAIPFGTGLAENSGYRCRLLDDFGHTAPGLHTGGHQLKNSLLELPALEVAGDLAELWPFLLIGEAVHVGRGATVGLGRFRIGIA